MRYQSSLRAHSSYPSAQRAPPAILRARAAACVCRALAQAAPSLLPFREQLGRISTGMDEPPVQPPPVQVIESSFLRGGVDPARSAPAAAAETQRTTLHLVILNWSLPTWLIRVWPTALVRVCADGGANRLYDELPGMLPHQPPDLVRGQFLPDLIHGDLDSIRPEVLHFYQARGVRVDKCPDQDSTDLGKCLAYLERQHAHTLLPPAAAAAAAAAAGDGGGGGDAPPAPQGNGVDGGGGAAQGSWVEEGLGAAGQQGVVLAVGALGGRLDHTLSNLNALYMHRHLSLALIGEGNLVRLVRAGRCVIRPAQEVEGPLCGLVPLAGPATVTMTGFRWNLERGEMRVGGLVSTSNIMDSDTITVETDVDLVWTTQLHDPPAP